MTVFQHGTKPAYKPDAPHTTLHAIEALCEGLGHWPSANSALLLALSQKLSPRFDETPFDSADWAKRVLGDQTSAILLQALIEQSMYGYKKYGTILQPNVGENGELDYFNEAVLELADCLNYGQNCVLQGDLDEVRKLVRLLQIVKETLEDQLPEFQ